MNFPYYRTESKSEQTLAIMRISKLQQKRDLPNWVEDNIHIPWDWVMNKYNYNRNRFTAPPIRFSYSARFGAFYHGHPRYFNGHPHIRIVKRSLVWYTYKKKTAKLYADGIELDNKVHRMVLSLVHEYTHFIQFKEERTASEVETTRNEIEYVKQNHPKYYRQLKTFE